MSYRCCCCGSCTDDTTCCNCICRFLCVKLEIPAGCGTPPCTVAEVELRFDTTTNSWIGTITCGNASIDVDFYISDVGGDCKLCLRSTCLGYGVGSESCKPGAGAISCSTLTASWPLTAQQLSDCSGGLCATTGTLSTKCSKSHSPKEGTPPVNCLTCECICDCLCFVAITSDCPDPQPVRKKGCWDATIPGFRVTMSCTGLPDYTIEVKYTLEPVFGDCIVLLNIPSCGVVDVVMGLCFNDYANYHILATCGTFAICLDIKCLLCDQICVSG